MIEVKEKPNDWLVSLALNEGSGPANFAEAGLTPENTQMMSKDYYKSTKFIQDNFKNDDGSFNDEAFNNLYDQSLKSYQSFATNSFDKSYLDQVEYSFSNVYRPKGSSIRNDKYEVKRIQNPFKENRGLQGFGTIEESKWSASEIAQQNKVIDFETGKTLDWTPNEKGGFGGFFRDSLVLAQWDEDGEHEDENGVIVKHQAGDYKYNEDGELCYETLGNRDASQKQFLSAFDTITDDGSFWNKMDIFDADGKEQEITKTILRAGLKYAPVAIGAIAGSGILATAGSVYLGATALLNLGDALPNLWKAIEGITVGTDDDNRPKSSIWNAMNKLQAFTKGTSFGTSEYSKNKNFTWENTINMIADVSLQLGQQTVVAKIPKVLGLDKSFLKGASNIEDYVKKSEQFNEYSKRLASAYMVITSGADSYGTAKESGFSDRAAGLITLGTLAGLSKVMSSDIGEWAMKGIGLDDMRLAGKPIVRKISERLATAMNKDGKINIVDEKSRNKLLKEVRDGVVKGFSKFIEDPITLKGAMLAEALEEVSEEMVMDFNMALGMAASAMGVTRKVNYDYLDPSNVIDRYMMSAFGGAIGGGIHKIKTPWAKTHKALTDGEENQKLLNFVWENGVDETIRIIEKEYKSGNLAGNKNLSNSMHSILEGKPLFESSKDELDSQAWAVKEGLINLVRTYGDLLTQTGSINMDTDVRRALSQMTGQVDPVVQQLMDFGLEDRVADQIQDLNALLVLLYAEKTDMPESDSKFGPINKRIAEIQLKKNKILEGEHFDHYFQQGLLWMDNTVRDLFVHANKNDFTVAITGKNYDSLSDYEKGIIDSKYLDYNDLAKPALLEGAVDILNYGLNKLTPKAMLYDKSYNLTRNKALEIFSSQMSIKLSSLRQLFDEQGNISSAKMKLFDNPTNRNINEFPLTTIEALDDIDSKNLSIEEQQQVELNGVIENIQALIDSGIPMSSEFIEPIKKVQTTIKLRLTEREKTNKNDILSKDLGPLQDPGGFDYSDLPIISDLMKTSYDPIVFDFKKAKTDLEKLDDNELAELVPYPEDLAGFLEIGDFSGLDEDLQNKKIGEHLKKIIKDTLNKIEEGLQKGQTKNEIDFVNNIDKLVSKSVKNPIYEYLDEVRLLTGSNTEGIMKVFADESTRLTNTEALNYIMDKPDLLRQALEDIKIALKMIAMTTNAEGGGTYGKNLNLNRNKYKRPGLEEIGLIDPNAAINMSTDLEVLSEKIKFLIRLSDFNMSDRLRAHKNAAGKFYKMFGELYNPDSTNQGLIIRMLNKLDPEAAKKVASIYLDVDNDTSGLLLLLEQELTISITPKTLAKAEIIITKLEDATFEAFQEILKKFNGNKKQIIEQLIQDPAFFKITQHDKDSIVETKTSKVSQHTDHLTDNDKMVYFLSILSSKSSEYKTYLKETLEETEKDADGKDVFKFEYSPLFAQEYPCRIAYGQALDPELFNVFLLSLTNGKKELIYPILENLIYINGYHGTGKTSATANIIHSILKRKLGADYATVASVAKSQSENFAKSLGEKTGLSKDELIGKITQGKPLTDFVLNHDKNPNLIGIKQDALNVILNNTEIGKVIYIDEVTLYNAAELKFLTEWCKQTNRSLITLGDDIQQGASRNIAYFATIKTPTLENSMRAGSTITIDNLKKLIILAAELEELDYNLKTSANIIPIFETNYPTISLKYHEDSNGKLTGVKLVKESDLKGTEKIDTIRLFIQKSLTPSNNKVVDPEKIAIIYDSKTDPEYSELLSLSTLFGVKLIPFTEMQGSEFDYVVVTSKLQKPAKGSDKDSVLKFIKKLNTVLSRAKLGTLVIDKGLDLNNTKEEYNNIFAYDPQKLQEFRDDRLLPLTEIAANAKPISQLQLQLQLLQSGGKTNPPKPENELETILTDDLGSSMRLPEKIITENKKSNEQVIKSGKGVNVNDGMVVCTTQYTTFGGFIDEDGKHVIYPTIEDSKGNEIEELYFDLGMFGNDTDENDAYINFGEDGNKVELYVKENTTDGSGNIVEKEVLNKQLFLDLDAMKKEILASKDLLDLRKIIAKYNFSMSNGLYDWDKAEFRIMYTKRDNKYDKNYEVGNDNNINKSIPMRRIILYVPSTSGDGTGGVFTLGFMNDKAVDDRYKELDKAAEAGLSNGAQYHMFHLNPSDINTYGISTRLLGGKDNSGNNKVTREYTMKELRDDLSWKNMSRPNIFTGVTTSLYELMETNDDDTNDKISEAIDKMFDEMNINGRPVMFISRDIRTKDMTSELLREQYLKQKRYQLAQENNWTAPKVEDMVSMVVLSTKPRTINEFFNDYSDAIDMFKDDKSIAKSYINTVAHKYTGLSMLRGIYETLNVMGPLLKSGELDDYEKGIYTNLNGIATLMRLAFGIVPVTIKVKGETLIHAAFLDDDNSKKVINPNNEELLKKIIKKIEKKQSNNKFISQYYNNILPEGFNYSDILTLIIDILAEAKSDNQIKYHDANNIERSILPKSVINSLTYALTGKLVRPSYKDRAEQTYTTPKGHKPRYPNGVESHSSYKGTRNDETGLFEEAVNSEDEFIIKNLVIESVHLVVNTNNAVNLDEANKLKEAEKRKKQENKNNLIQLLKSLNLPSGTLSALENAINENEDINYDKLNNILKNKTIALLNSGETNNPLLSLSFSDESIVEERFLDLKVVSDLINQNNTVIPFKCTSEKPDVEFKKGSEITKYVFDSATKKLIEQHTTEVESGDDGNNDGNLSENDLKLNQYRKDYDSFINKLLESDDLLDPSIREDLEAMLDPYSKENVSFQELAFTVKFFDQRGMLDEFKKLMDRKLEFIC